MRPLVTLFFSVLCLCLAATATQAQEITLNRVVAVINGDPITLHEVELQSMPAFSRAKINPNEPADRAKMDEILKATLDDMIVDKLISQDAERLGVTATDADVEAEIQDIMKRNNLKSQTELERALAVQGLDMQSFKQRLRSNLINARLTNQMVARQILIPRADIDKYYAEHKEEFVDREVDFQILVFNPGIKPGDVPKIAAAVKGGKIPFNEAVQKFSVGPASDSDGAVKNAHWRDVAPEIRAVLESAQVGQITDVVKVNEQSMMFILLRLGDPVQKSLEESRGEIENILKMPLAKTRFEEYVNQLRNKAVIDIRM